jgi:hypothetical protein
MDASGNKYSGTFTFLNYDLNHHLIAKVKGNVVAKRITVDYPLDGCKFEEAEHQTSLPSARNRLSGRYKSSPAGRRNSECNCLHVDVSTDRTDNVPSAEEATSVTLEEIKEKTP